MKKDLLKKLNNGDILICDGSTGIALQYKGCNPGESVEKWGLEHKDILMSLHAGYIDAGADIILTNTLGGNKIKLRKYGLENEVESLNKSLAELAREVVSRYTKTVYVAGNIGPTGELMEPYGTLSESDMIEVFSQQTKALVDGEVDFIYIETMIDVNEAVSAVKAVKATCDLPIFASMSFNPDRNGFRTVMGNTPEQAVDMLQSAGADVVGSNCGSVLASMMPDLIKQMKSAGARLIAVEPNAGIPQLINGKTVFPETPEEMAIHVPAMIDAGANVVGGCCGSMAEHISLIAKTAREYSSNRF
ncbi:MAG: homocysteine S-methyltransferase family protein [Candidatus Poribacteria bacterium]